MLKKILITASILSLFVGIFIVQAKNQTVYHFEDQYIDALNIPWTKSVETVEKTLNTFYDKPEASGKWTLECGDGGVCHPFYMYDGEKHIIKTYYVFGTKNQLKSITAQYESGGYELLIENIEKNFNTGGVVTTNNYAHHIYEKDYRNAHITVEVIKKGSINPITFIARIKTIKEDKGDSKDGDIAISNTDPSILYRGAVRAVFAYYILRNIGVNL
jgi:hypothetical protein